MFILVRVDDDCIDVYPYDSFDDALVESFMKKWAACHVRNFEEKLIVSFYF